MADEDLCHAFLIIGWFVVAIMIAVYAWETWELNNTPYKTKNRLNDLISAITEMGSNKYALKSVSKWAECLHGNAEHWQKIFYEHPEIFRQEKNGDKWGLRYRLNFAQDVELEKLIVAKAIMDYPFTMAENGLTDEIKENLEDHFNKKLRRPMTDDEISKVINMAISLHTAALTQSRDAKWFLPILATIAVALLGIYFKK